MNYKIVDNFLNIDDFNFIKENTINCSTFPFYLNHTVASDTSKDGIFFNTAFKNWDDKSPIPSFDLIRPLLDAIEPEKEFNILRCQLNLYPRTFFRHHHDYHIDDTSPHKACLLSLNTCNGFTILKDGIFGKKIKSVENRALFFEAHKQHKSTTCTNSPFRANIIVNYRL